MHKYPTHPQLRGMNCSSATEVRSEQWAMQKAALYLHQGSVSIAAAVIPSAVVEFSHISAAFAVDGVD